jgi:uncharacterized protein YbjT (DUF2867 family)
MKAFVAGATGKTGRAVVDELIKRGIPVVALVREQSKGLSLLPHDLQIVVGDVLDPTSFQTALTDCSIVICATGAQPSFDITGPYQVDYLGTKNLVDLAKENQIEHFILVSSLCVSKFFHPLNLFWLVLYWKQQAENYLRQSGLTYTIVRPGGLKDNDNTDSLVMSSADTLFEGSIPRIKVAQTCVESIFHPSAFNKTIEIVTNPGAQAQDWEKLFSLIS